MSPTPRRELFVGSVLVAALVAFVALLIKASTGPGFLSARTTVDVLFQDGQGIRAGSPVRIAGLDVGQVTAVDLAEVDDVLLARIRVSFPKDVAARLRADARITVQNNITGQNCINVIHAGKSSAPLPDGATVRGIETTFFDPILEEVGLGPNERADLGHSISRVRQAIDEVAPRLSAAVEDAAETVATVKGTVAEARPDVTAALDRVANLAERLEAQGPRVESALSKLDAVMTQLESTIGEARPDVLAAAASARDALGGVDRAVQAAGPKVVTLVEGLIPVRQRLERVLYNGELITGQAADVMSKNKANLERAMGNVREATEWASQLVQKIHSNPFLISPFYKPKAEDIRAQGAADSARVLTNGAKELNDLIKTLDALSRQPMTEARRREVDHLTKRAHALMDWMGQAERQVGEATRGSMRR